MNDAGVPAGETQAARASQMSAPEEGDERPAPPTAEPGPANFRLAALGWGLFLLFVFVRLDRVFHYGARFGPFLASVSEQEFAFWTTHLLLALPGCALLAYGVSPRMATVTRGWVAAFRALDARGWKVAAGAYGVLLFAFAHVGRQVVLLDLPVTDDENMVLFGARMIARGDLRVPALTPPGAFTDLFLFVRDGHVSAIDFPGGLFFRAASVVTGTGGLLYALAAAVAGVAVVAAAMRLTDYRGAMFAALIWLFSPMVFALSMTTHAHVVSRCFLGLALYFAARVLATRAGERPQLAAAAMGVCAGAAFLTRSVEIGMILAPLGVLFVTRAVRDVRGYRRYVAYAVLGLLPALAVYGWYNDQLTGEFFRQARFAHNEQAAHLLPEYTLWNRIPVNLCFEVLMVSVWFLGPLGLGLAWLGVSREEPVTVALACGFVGALSITLTHQYTGIHAVGPIHFSETPVVLTLLATFGVRRATDWLRTKSVSVVRSAWVLAATVALGYGTFNAYHCDTLLAQAEDQMLPFTTVAEHRIHHAVVLADSMAPLYTRHRTGSWVLQYPHPDPYFRDDVIWATPGADLAALRVHFPDRAFYRLEITADPEMLRLVRLR